MKKAGGTGGGPGAPGAQRAGADAAAGGAAGDAAGEARAGDASNADAKGSPPPMSPGEVLKVVGVSALAMGGLAGLAYLVHRSEQRELQVFEQDRRERMAAFERETLARRRGRRCAPIRSKAPLPQNPEQSATASRYGAEGHCVRIRSTA